MDAAKKKKGFLKPSTRENFCIYWYNFRSNKLSMVGLAIVVISLIFAIFAPYVAPFPEHAGAYVDLANAGVADEKYFYHILITPFLLCISSQMPNIAGFFGIFLFLCFRGIFLNFPVFSHVFSCNIGKSVSK